MSDPLDHRQRIGLLDGHIFVDHGAVGLARPANIDTQQRDARLCQKGACNVVSVTIGIALAVRKVFEDRARGRLAGGVRQKQSRRKARSIRHRDPHILDDPD